MPLHSAPADDTHWISADTAAQLLGVRKSSLYSYVSRGLLQARKPPNQRASQYLRTEVARLSAQRAAAHNPGQTARQALDWGQAVLPSALTLIENGRFYYRGHDAVHLSRQHSLEDIADLLWSGALPAKATQHKLQQAQSLPNHLASAHWQSLQQLRQALPAPEATYPLLAWGQLLASFPELVSQSAGWPLTEQATAMLHMLQCALVAEPAIWPTPAKSPQQNPAAPLHIRLQAAWGLTDSGADLVRRALVLCADHELNASSFAVRVAASTGAPLYAAISAGLAAFSGAQHGGSPHAIQARWAQCLKTFSQAQGEGSPNQQLAMPVTSSVFGSGFGHPLYPEGDPRAAALLALLAPDAARQRWISSVHESTGLAPGLDFALVAVSESLGLPQHAPVTLFALGRSVGWVAHFLEQHSSPALLRPRASYQGLAPIQKLAQEASPAKATGRIVRFR